MALGRSTPFFGETPHWLSSRICFVQAPFWRSPVLPSHPQPPFSSPPLGSHAGALASAAFGTSAVLAGLAMKEGQGLLPVQGSGGNDYLAPDSASAGAMPMGSTGLFCRSSGRALSAHDLIDSHCSHCGCTKRHLRGAPQLTRIKRCLACANASVAVKPSGGAGGGEAAGVAVASLAAGAIAGAKPLLLPDGAANPPPPTPATPTSWKPGDPRPLAPPPAGWLAGDSGSGAFGEQAQEGQEGGDEEEEQLPPTV
jgi:hypothetical protein